MKFKRETFFIHIVANIVIVFAIGILITGSVLGNKALPVAASGKAIYQGNSANPNVSLMINVYWGTEYLEGILKVLKKYDVKTTFFVGGSWVTENGDMLKKINADGHEIGSHGYRHRDHSKLNHKQNEDEIIITEKLVQAIIGKKMTLFAPPSGAMGSAMFNVCEEQGYKVIMWSRDTIDWRDKDDNLVFKRATNKISNGDLILMHPTEHTLKALPRILDEYKKQGIKAVTVSTNIASLY